MSKKDLKIEVTREEFEKLQFYKECYFSFMKNPDNAVLEEEYFYNAKNKDYSEFYKVYFCKSALEKIESVKIQKLEVDNKTYLAKIDVLEQDIYKLKNRNIIQRILNK